MLKDWAACWGQLHCVEMEERVIALHGPCEVVKGNQCAEISFKFVLMEFVN